MRGSLLIELNKIVDVCQKIDVHAQNCIGTSFVGALISDEQKMGSDPFKKHTGMSGSEYQTGLTPNCRFAGRLQLREEVGG
jgi:hypothetical protein